MKMHGCAPEDSFFNNGTFTVRAKSIFLRNNIFRQDYFQMRLRPHVCKVAQGITQLLNDNNSGRYVNTVQNGR